MAKIFRGKRMQTLKENRFFKYLLYALGEILLIVIGILIAMNLNNYNENLKKIDTKNQLLEQLKKENKFNLAFLIEDVAYRDTLDVAIYKLFQFLKEADLEAETEKLQNHLIPLFRSTTYTFGNNYLNKYINSYSEENDLLIDELINLDAQQKDLRLITEINQDFKLKHMFEALAGEIDFNNLEIISYDVLKSLRFRNNVSLLEDLESEVFNKFESTLNQQQKVDSLITVILEE